MHYLDTLQTKKAIFYPLHLLKVVMYPDLKMLHPCDGVTLWRVLPIFVMTRVTISVLRPRDVSCHDTINPADTTKTIMHTAQMSTAIECVEVHKHRHARA